MSELAAPEGDIRGGFFVALRATMPKATVYEDCEAQSFVGNIRPSRKCFVVDSVSLSSRPKKPSNCEFRICVLAWNAGHESAASMLGKKVSQRDVAW